MITVNNVYFPNGYTSLDHLLPEGDEVFADIIGIEFRSLRAIKDAVWKAANKYDEETGYYKLVGPASTITTRAEIIMANGDKRTVFV